MWAEKFVKGLFAYFSAPFFLPGLLTKLSTGEDYRYRKADGGTPTLMNRFMHRYIDQVLKLTTRDATVRRRFFEVQGMLKPPSTLFRPGIGACVILNALGECFGRAKSGMIEVEASPRLREQVSPSKF